MQEQFINSLLKHANIIKLKIFAKINKYNWGHELADPNLKIWNQEGDRQHFDINNFIQCYMKQTTPYSDLTHAHVLGEPKIWFDMPLTGQEKSPKMFEYKKRNKFAFSKKMRIKDKKSSSFRNGNENVSTGKHEGK